MTDTTLATMIDDRLAWFARVLRIDYDSARTVWHKGFETTRFHQFELNSVLAAVAMLSPFDIACFDATGTHERLPAGTTHVATAYDSTMKCPVISEYCAIETADGERVVVMALDANGEVDVLVFATDDTTKHRMVEQLKALVTGAASCWRGKRVLFTASEVSGYRHMPPVRTTDIDVDAEVADELRRNLIVPITRYGTDDRLADRRGVLVHGRPGTGKSRALEWVQGEVADHATVILTTPVMLGRAHYLTDLFAMAASAAPCLVVLEDLDVAFTGRESSGYTSDVMGELVSFLDGPDRRRGVFIAATTNYPKALDSSLIKRPGRFDRKILIDDASTTSRSAMVQSVLARIGGDESQIDAIVSRTDDWTLAEIEEAGQLAVLIALDTDAPVDMLGALDEVHRGTKGIDAEPKKVETGYV